MTNNLKITAVGDGIVGKTCLLIAYTSHDFPQDYIPTVFEHYGQNIVVDGIEYNMTLWDTAGQEDYERLRPLSYPNTNCFLVCFSVDGKASYDNVVTKWVPEIRHRMPHTPIVLVATKTDLRADPEVVCFGPEDGKKLKKKIKADAYVECSAKEMQGLDEVFETAVQVCVKRKAGKNKKKQNGICALL